MRINVAILPLYRISSDRCQSAYRISASFAEVIKGSRIRAGNTSNPRRHCCLSRCCGSTCSRNLTTSCHQAAAEVKRAALRQRPLWILPRWDQRDARRKIKSRVCVRPMLARLAPGQIRWNRRSHFCRISIVIWSGSWSKSTSGIRPRSQLSSDVGELQKSRSWCAPKRPWN